jgi:ABC-type antimicrobial peptide transport system permease subunit
MSHFPVTQGQRLRAPREMMLGKLAATTMKKRPGDSIQLMGSVYRIVGIYETGIGYEDGAGVIDLKEAQALFKKPNQVNMYGIKLQDLDKADVIRRQVEVRWPGVSVSRSSEFAEKSNDMQVTRTMVAAISFISILVGGIGTMNTMLMSVYERTREIGTLRALGWRRRRVVGLILREALVLSLLSGLVGIGMGLGLTWLMQAEPSMGVWFQATYSPRLFAQAMGVALVLGGVGALYPAWRAANLSPIEALRYE